MFAFRCSLTSSQTYIEKKAGQITAPRGFDGPRSEQASLDAKYLSKIPGILAIKQKGHVMDALAPAGDEGRGKLRYASGSGTHALIRGFPNGATHPPQADTVR